MACMASLDKLFRIDQMISNELLDGRDHLVFELGWTLCYPYREIVQFLGICLQPFSVTKQEREQGRYGNSFVSVLKRMVLDHEVEQNTGLCHQARIQRFARKSLKWGQHTAFKDIQKPSREIWYGLVERKMLLGKSEGKILYLRDRYDSHYSLPKRFRTSPYS